MSAGVRRRRKRGLSDMSRSLKLPSGAKPRWYKRVGAAAPAAPAGRYALMLRSSWCGARKLTERKKGRAARLSIDGLRLAGQHVRLVQTRVLVERTAVRAEPTVVVQRVAPHAIGRVVDRCMPVAPPGRNVGRLLVAVPVQELAEIRGVVARARAATPAGRSAYRSGRSRRSAGRAPSRRGCARTGPSGTSRATDSRPDMTRTSAEPDSLGAGQPQSVASR